MYPVSRFGSGIGRTRASIHARTGSVSRVHFSSASIDDLGSVNLPFRISRDAPSIVHDKRRSPEDQVGDARNHLMLGKDPVEDQDEQSTPDAFVDTAREGLQFVPRDHVGDRREIRYILV